MKAAVRSRPAAPAQRTATMRWCPPSPLACPSSRTTARSTPTPTARPEWVSVWMGTCNFLFRCPSLFFLQSCRWKEFAKCTPDRVKMLPLFSPTATCEMCGMVGVRDAFYSKTKRFCSVSCSRSYSSNSKKASILARLQVRASFAATVMYFAHYDQLVNIDEIFWCVFRANHQRKKQRFCRNSL